MWISWRRLQLAMAEARLHDDDDEDSDSDNDAWTVSEPEAEPDPAVPELVPEEVPLESNFVPPPPHGHPSVANLDQVPLELYFGPPSGDGDGENAAPPWPSGEGQVIDVQDPLPPPSADALPVPLANNGEVFWV